jgi:hypothetical protein
MAAISPPSHKSGTCRSHGAGRERRVYACHSPRATPPRSERGEISKRERGDKRESPCQMDPNGRGGGKGAVCDQKFPSPLRPTWKDPRQDTGVRAVYWKSGKGTRRDQVAAERARGEPGNSQSMINDGGGPRGPWARGGWLSCPQPGREMKRRLGARGTSHLACMSSKCPQLSLIVTCRRVTFR